MPPVSDSHNRVPTSHRAVALLSVVGLVMWVVIFKLPAQVDAPIPERSATAAPSSAPPLDNIQRLEGQAEAQMIPCSRYLSSEASKCEASHKDFADALLLAHLGQPFFMGKLIDFYSSGTSFGGFFRGEHYTRSDKVEACAWAFIRAQMKSSDFLIVYQETWFAGCVLNNAVPEEVYRQRAAIILQAAAPPFTSYLYGVTVRAQPDEAITAVAEKLVVEHFLQAAAR